MSNEKISEILALTRRIDAVYQRANDASRAHLKLKKVAERQPVDLRHPISNESEQSR
jgi:predicted rRNA methylase YqxC with S4 and FtsJ domains